MGFGSPVGFGEGVVCFRERIGVENGAVMERWMGGFFCVSRRFRLPVRSGLRLCMPELGIKAGWWL